MSAFSNFVDEGTKDSLRSVLQVVGSFNRFLLKFIWLPILVAIGLGYYFRMQQSEEPVLYTARLTFVESSKLNTIPNVQNYSVNLPGGSTSQTDVITGILNSDAVIGKALFTSVNSKSEELLINLYTRVYMPSYYEKNRFTKTALDSLSADQKSVYKSIFNKIISINSDLLTYESTQVKRITSVSKSEELSYALVNNVYDSLVDFYQSNQSTSYDNTIDILTQKRDSTYNVLKALEANLAQRRQRSGLKVTQVEELPNTDLYRKIQLTQGNYQSLYSQVERLKTQRSQNFVTYFRQLNYPMLPLSKSSNPILKQTIIGAAIGFFAGLFLVVIIYVIVQGVLFYKSLYQ